MDENHLQKLIEVEQRGKSNSKRLDEHDSRLDKLEDSYNILTNMDFRMGKVETAVEKIDKKLDTRVSEMDREKGKKWDKLIDYVFYFILATVLTYIAVQLGLK